MSDRRLYLVLGGVALVVFCACLVAYVSMRRHDRSDDCVLNMRRISLALLSAMNQRDERWDAIAPGRAFWAAYPNWPTRHDQLSPANLVCPVYGRSTAGVDIEYRGPAKSYRLLDHEDAVCSDRDVNHGKLPLNVLFKDGSCRPFPPDSDGWRKSLTTTSD